MARRFALAVFAAFAVFASPTPGSAAEPARAPAPREVYPRFDLTYLPAIGTQGVIGFRPTEIAKFATESEVKTVSKMLLSFCFDTIGEGKLDAAEPPALADIEQCVLCLNMKITPPKPDEQGTFLLGGMTPCVVRTINAFDWDRLIRKWFPTATRERHAERSYLRISLQSLPKGTEPFAIYVPDDRTLVCATEEEIHELLDRLAAGKPAPKAPALWSEVDRDFAAAILDNREEKLIDGEFKADDASGKSVESIADSLQTVAMGLSVGDETNVRIVANAMDEKSAKGGIRAFRKLMKVVKEKAAQEEEPTGLEILAIEALKNTKVVRDGSRVTITTSAKGNVIVLLLNLFREPT